MNIKKAIFVVAGLGTRFLPATKAQPKEMLPIVDKPIIQYLVEEATDAGIEEIIFVTGRDKVCIENHFDKSYELENILRKKNKLDKLKEVESIAGLASCAYVRQPVQKGDGHALLCAKPFIDDTESVLVVFPDYLMSKEAKAIQSIININKKYNSTVVCGDVVDKKDISKYGMIDYQEIDQNGTVKINKFVEKPKPEDATSNLISAGYFVITPEVMEILGRSESTVGDGEIRIADALVKAVSEGVDVYAYKPEKPGYDCGSILGFLKATVDFGLEKENVGEDFSKFLKDKFC